MHYRFAFLLVLILGLSACGETSFAPKPRAYPKVDFPQGEWKNLEGVDCPFIMEVPEYAKVVQDSSLFGERPPSDCWFDVEYPTLSGKVHFSYLPTDGAKTFDELRTDAFKMAGWHNRKANYIDEQLIENEFGGLGLSFRMEGPVASPFQFFMTDSTRSHFLRGSVYVQAQINVDSLAPVYDFILQDVDRMINTLNWK